MICFECRRAELVVSTIHPVGVRNGESFVVEMLGLKCPKCGFETIDSEQSSQFTRLVSDKFRAAHGLLTGAEIKAHRSLLGMSQQEFADHLSTGVASVKRWEAGQIQERAMDQLIRLKTDPDAARRNLRDLEQQIPEPLVVFDSGIVALTMTAAEGTYVERAPMIVETLAFDEDDEASAVCIAA
jgi:putative zinc finger/helix-turn-helix YgiT family protein